MGIKTPRVSDNPYKPKEIIHLLAPIFGEQAIIAFASFALLTVISHLGGNEFAAISTVDVSITLLIYFFMGISLGGQVLTSRHKGKNETEKINTIAGQAIIAGIIISLVVSTLIILFKTTILKLLFGQDYSSLGKVGEIYLMGWCYSSPVFGAFQSIQGILRGIGETGRSMVYAIIANVIYMLMVWFFIDVFNIGVYSTTVAFAVSRTVGLLMQLAYLFSYKSQLTLKNGFIKCLEFNTIRNIVVLGAPFALEQIIAYGGKLVTAGFVVRTGSVNLMANSIMMSIMNIFIIPMNAMIVGIPTIVGFCLGSGKVEWARYYIQYIGKLTNLIACLVMLVTLTAIKPIADMYGADEKVFKVLIVLTIMYVATSVFTLGAGYVYPAGLRTGGDAVFTSVTTCAISVVIRITFGYIACFTLGFGIYGLNFSINLEMVIRTVVFSNRLKTDKWYIGINKYEGGSL